VRNKTEYFLQPDAARYSGRAISSNKKIKEVRSRGVVDVEQRKAKDGSQRAAAGATAAKKNNKRRREA
jgi:hypothetical protein